jgi:lactoylglutathione lyase
MEGTTKYPGYTHVALEISDAKSLAKKIVQLGLTITEEVEFKGVKFFFIRDPDGHNIEMVCHEEEDSQILP